MFNSMHGGHYIAFTFSALLSPRRLSSSVPRRCRSLLPLLQALEYQVAQGLAGGAAEPLHLVPLNPLRHTHSEELHAHVAVVRLLLPPPQLGRL